ncbi:MAG: DUF333 domain-containing protein [Vibrio sp.]|uniref:putative hemolysin n=1 Tax=Vibrio TaxID=662 RepID=UPI001EC3AF6F|nr:DUF333 domain-containing protein [Vibrio sp.]NRB67725.1 DUF333 domain-containing protein [Vibrio sp.]
MKTTTWALISVSALLLAGCANEPDEYEVKGYTSIANPASVFCAKQGGKLETVSENEKRVTYCVLSSDNRIEEWEYYRQHQKSSDS